MPRNQAGGISPNHSEILRLEIWRLEKGSSSVAIIGILAAVSVLFASLGTALGFGLGLVKTQLVADLAALTAADTLVGAVAGYPCENAEMLARFNGASLTTCRIVGLVAQVSTATSLGPFQISRWAEAG